MVFLVSCIMFLGFLKNKTSKLLPFPSPSFSLRLCPSRCFNMNIKIISQNLFDHLFFALSSKENFRPLRRLPPHRKASTLPPNMEPVTSVACRHRFQHVTAPDLWNNHNVRFPFSSFWTTANITSTCGPPSRESNAAHRLNPRETRHCSACDTVHSIRQWIFGLALVVN